MFLFFCNLRNPVGVGRGGWHKQMVSLSIMVLEGHLISCLAEMYCHTNIVVRKSSRLCGYDVNSRRKFKIIINKLKSKLLLFYLKYYQIIRRHIFAQQMCLTLWTTKIVKNSWVKIRYCGKATKFEKISHFFEIT